ncbi:MAG: hypothetical protein JWM82_2211, partial [Myxococcales bacterium]|nr:hypothetical protein [Myxococcales bacterium]
MMNMKLLDYFRRAPKSASMA